MNWKKVLGGIAPTIGRALGGPVGGIALDALAKALGVDPKDETALEKKVASLTAGDLIAIKNAEHQFIKDMKELDLDFDKLEAADRANARQREVDTHDNWTPRILAGLTIGAFLFVVYYVLAGKVDGLKEPMQMGLVGTVIGYASAKADQVIGYYFGSSASSRAKDLTIGRLTDSNGKK